MVIDVFSWAILLTSSLGAPIGPAQDGSGPDSAPGRAEALIAELRREGDEVADVDARRDAAKAIFAADRAVRLAALPAMIDALLHEKDGQVRLAVLDAVTALGPDAEPAIPALVRTLETDAGGRRREETHQDYRSALALASIGRPAVEALRSLLVEEKEHIRAEAAMALGRIGPDASAAVPDLVPMLGDPSDRIRQEASTALAGIGPEAVGPLIEAATLGNDLARPRAVEALGLMVGPDDRARSALVDRAADPSSPGVRAAAVLALGRIGTPDETLRPVLAERLGDEGEGVRLAVVGVLADRPGLLAGLAPTLGSLLTSGDEEAARVASYLLPTLGPEAAPLLMDALRDERSPVDPIAGALARIGRPISAMLAGAIADPSPRVRRGAALAIGRMRPEPEGAVAMLAEALGDEEPEVRADVVAALVELGPRARSAVPAVRETLRDGSAEIRLRALGFLVRSAPRDDLLTADLTGLILDDDARVRRSAIEAARSLGPSGRAALPAAIGALEDPDASVRLAAAELIAGHGPAAAEAVPALASMLASPDEGRRATAARTLAALGASARPAFDQLAPLLDDEAASVREAAVLALGGAAPDTEAARPLLAKALGDDTTEVRSAARRAIQRVGPGGVIFVPDLIASAALEEDRRSAERSLRRFERTGPAPGSIPELIDLLDHEHESVRLLAARFLALAGPDARQAVPALTRLRDDPSPEVRAEADAALGRIEAAPGT